MIAKQNADSVLSVSYVSQSLITRTEEQVRNCLEKIISGGGKNGEFDKGGGACTAGSGPAG